MHGLLNTIPKEPFSQVPQLSASALGLLAVDASLPLQPEGLGLVAASGQGVPRQVLKRAGRPHVPPHPPREGLLQHILLQVGVQRRVFLDCCHDVRAVQRG